MNVHCSCKLQIRERLSSIIISFSVGQHFQGLVNAQVDLPERPHPDYANVFAIPPPNVRRARLVVEDHGRPPGAVEKNLKRKSDSHESSSYTVRYHWYRFCVKTECEHQRAFVRDPQLPPITVDQMAATELKIF